MGRNRRRFLAVAITGAAIASPAFLGAASAHATVAPSASSSSASSAAAPAASTDTPVPAGFTPVPAGTYTPLPVGDSNLAETRSYETLAPGVTLTHIVRGTVPASIGAVNTTLEGPFVVNEVTIDPHRAKGHLQIVHGQYLTSRETVGDLVAKVHGMAGINASFFDIDDDYGTPVSLSVENGQLVGNPDGEQDANGVASGELNGPVINSATNRLVLNGTYSWSGTARNTATGQSLPLTEVDKKPFVPSACASLTDQTQCTVPGDLVRFTPTWGAETPAGDGVEVVLGSRGDVVSVNRTRGTALHAGQTSLQATGSTAAALLSLVKGGGHLKTTLKLLNNGQPVPLTPDTQAATASSIQIDNGVNEDPYPNGTDTPASRNPLTGLATTRNGDIILFTVEGRSTFSVGMTYQEESAALADLGAYNAVNLDGGGSTQLVADGQYATTSSDGYVNTSSGTEFNGTERDDGDAVVWTP